MSVSFSQEFSFAFSSSEEEEEKECYVCGEAIEGEGIQYMDYPGKICVTCDVSCETCGEENKKTCKCAIDRFIADAKLHQPAEEHEDWWEAENESGKQNYMMPTVLVEATAGHDELAKKLSDCHDLYLLRGTDELVVIQNTLVCPIHEKFFGGTDEKGDCVYSVDLKTGQWVESFMGVGEFYAELTKKKKVDKFIADAKLHLPVEEHREWWDDEPHDWETLLGEKGPPDVYLLRGTRELFVIGADPPKFYGMDHIHAWGHPDGDTCIIDLETGQWKTLTQQETVEPEKEFSFAFSSSSEEDPEPEEEQTLISQLDAKLDELDRSFNPKKFNELLRAELSPDELSEVKTWTKSGKKKKKKKKVSSSRFTVQELF
eukprot:SAG11_NODE_2497_length_3289_cov_9.558307_3_plen_373_part_00